MAGLLQYQGSEIPESVRRAAQAALDSRAQSRIPLSMTGSNIPEGVRNAANKYLFGQEPVSMNQAREAQQRASAAAVAEAKSGGWTEGSRIPTAAEAKSLLTRAGQAVGSVAKAGGGIMAAYDLGSELNQRYGKGAYDTIDNAMQQVQTRRDMQADPGLAPRGQDTVNRITDNAMLGSRGVMEPTGSVTLKPTGGVRGLMDQARESGRVQKPSEAPKAPQGIPMEPEKVAAVESVAAAAPEVEAGRKRLQQGALQGLQSGEVHVSDLAKSVVESDEQRAGAPMKPEEKAQAVTAEIAAMKTMDKDKLSEYVSYALIAGGLLASVLDKSGQAGQAFHQSLNAQLDRNLAAGKMQAAQAQAAAKLALEERKVEDTERNTTSQIESRGSTADYQRGSLAVAERNAGVNQQNANTRARAASVAESQGNQRLGLMGAANDLRAQDTASKIAYRKSKIDNPTGGDNGVAPSFKDSHEIVESVYKAKGVDVDKNLSSQLASRIPTLSKKYPQMSAAELVELAAGELNIEQTGSDGMIWDNRKVRVKKEK